MVAVRRQTQCRSSTLARPSPLLGGGGALSYTMGQQHGGPPASNVAVAGGTRKEEGAPPPEAEGAMERFLTLEEAA